MKIEVYRDHLIPALISVASVVERRQTLPILSNLLVKTLENSLVLTATDLELQISCNVEGTIDVPGAITLPAKKLADICKALPDNSVIKLEVADKRAIIRCGPSRFMLSTMPAEDYPGLEGDSVHQSFEIDTELLCRMFECTSFAMAHQDVRYYLNGLLVQIHSGKLVLVATDGHRLAKSELLMPALDAWEQEKQLIFPAKTVSELKRMLGGKFGATTIFEIGDRSVVIRIGKNVLTTKLIDGRYPDYERVIPYSLKYTTTIDRETLRNALTRTAVLSYEKQKGVRMTFADGSLKLEVSNPEHEEAQEDIPIVFNGDDTTIGFNVSYWLDVLNAMTGNLVEVRFSDSEVSSILVDPESDGELYVVMPMRI
ncbi:DNA polymerase III subunit beta [Thiorhodovibrio winogradskyi]|uniref:Beta sliding clamp n=1 Tax=Thiorhodovibrio winogradskyi TaxID=77007 RepID=A0ABZ0S370_9GAMM|nr:DNA polymerase III subunit beta [Thiorhodovibrio winogradskyi]